MGHHGHLSVLMTFFACQTINSINLHNLSQSSENNGIFMAGNEWSPSEKYAQAIITLFNKCI